MNSLDNQPVQKKGRKRKTNAVQDGSLLVDTCAPSTIQNISSNVNTFFQSNPELPYSTLSTLSHNTTTNHVVNIMQQTVQQTVQPVADVKKRGRKPKGGKLTVKNTTESENITIIPNIILHLKCSLKDLDAYRNNQNKMISETLNYNPDIPPDIMTYNLSDQINTSNKLPYSSIDTQNSSSSVNVQNNDSFSRNPAYSENTAILNNYVCSKCNSSTQSSCAQIEDSNNISLKNINHKLKRLKIDLYKNSMLDKKSACFWCTYEYDSQICFIPKYEMDGSICGYGSFCRPECAVAYLMKEAIDDSTKFERYHLLNQIYSKVNNFKTNVKPAPDPHYLLDKFYGNLTIQEYRKLLNTEHIMLVIDKPLTRILPELHEDTDDFIVGIYGGTKGQGSTQAGGVYKVKRQSEKNSGPSKSSIMKGNFGLQT
jgi:hypothetical protein